MAEHVIAKDILKPHAIYWPTMLMAMELPLYQKLHVHGYWNVDDTKMSKSIGNVVRPKELVEAYGVDTLRYFTLREMSFGLDSSFSSEAIVARQNADLANDLGNLFSRATTMVWKYREGKVPAPDDHSEEDQALRQAAEAMLSGLPGDDGGVSLSPRPAGGLGTGRPCQQIHRRQRALGPGQGSGQGRPAGHRPLQSARMSPSADPDPDAGDAGGGGEDGGRSRVLAGRSADCLARLKAGSGGDCRRAANSMHWYALFPGLERKRKRPSPTKQPNTGGPPAGTGPCRPRTWSDFELFKQLELRVAEIVAAEPVKKSKKLVKLTVLAPEERTIVAGIAEHYRPEELVGRQVIIVANLKPAKIMGYFPWHGAGRQGDHRRKEKLVLSSVT